MARGKYTGAFALSALLGCSSSPDLYSGSRDNAAGVPLTRQEAQRLNNLPQKSDPNYIVASPADPEVERVMNDIVTRINSQPSQSIPINEFYGARVKLMYFTGPDGGGPKLGDNSPSGRKPYDSELVNAVFGELQSKRAYVALHGAFNGNYVTEIAAARDPRLSPPDFFVIADKNPLQLGGDLSNVYFARKDGNTYKFERAGNK